MVGIYIYKCRCEQSDGPRERETNQKKRSIQEEVRAVGGPLLITQPTGLDPNRLTESETLRETGTEDPQLQSGVAADLSLRIYLLLGSKEGQKEGGISNSPPGKRFILHNGRG
ncbi:hypothetical protein J5N97_010037 [Dioscorea zingiberensis]|uniref:Uncharacterized protein n=1 Tax=Dioscorea zingiberensis TaxID=325984 RepID=A0A9D5HN92_9LILI|nr:hypothetical protein J5N97_010037 [Dioscorea zingiberensis]